MGRRLRRRMDNDLQRGRQTPPHGVAQSRRRKPAGVVTVTTGCKDNPAEVSAAINVTQGPPSLILEYTVPAGGKIILPLSGAIDCTVDYGDGYSEKLALTLNPATGSLINYEYAEAGVYEVSVSGSVEQLYSLQGHSETSRSYLTAVKQWGNVNLTSMYYAFYLCSNLKTLPENTTDSFAEVTTFKYAFEGCSGLQTIPASLFSGCDKVTDVLGCFTKCASLTSVPENLLAPLKNVTSLQSFLAHCKQLKTIPAGFFRPKPSDHDAEIHLLRKYGLRNAACGPVQGACQRHELRGDFLRLHRTQRDSRRIFRRMHVGRHFPKLFLRQQSPDESGQKRIQRVYQRHILQMASGKLHRTCERSRRHVRRQP